MDSSEEELIAMREVMELRQTEEERWNKLDEEYSYGE